MTPQPEIPSDSELRVYHKRGLPRSMSSTYPHGHISGHPRNPLAQKQLEQRKVQILRSMDAEQIEAAYEDAAKKINAILEVDNKKNEEIDNEINKLKAQRELEKRLLQRQKEGRGAMKGGNLEPGVEKEEGDS